ncbi:MAG: hypothetical protein HQL29_01105 [Candidatus Omnitrophica bacterium]|nr:hypothetical protein [Candidatus Omnitrophota bacterium]
MIKNILLVLIMVLSVICFSNISFAQEDIIYSTDSDVQDVIDEVNEADEADERTASDDQIFSSRDAIDNDKEILVDEKEVLDNENILVAEGIKKTEPVEDQSTDNEELVPDKTENQTIDQNPNKQIQTTQFEDSTYNRPDKLTVLFNNFDIHSPTDVNQYKKNMVVPQIYEEEGSSPIKIKNIINQINYVDPTVKNTDKTVGKDGQAYEGKRVVKNQIYYIDDQNFELVFDENVIIDPTTDSPDVLVVQSKYASGYTPIIHKDTTKTGLGIPYTISDYTSEASAWADYKARSIGMPYTIRGKLQKEATRRGY